MVAGKHITADLVERARTRLNQSVRRGLPNDCWEWSGARDIRGYGRFLFRGKLWFAHRAAVAISGREVPPSAVVCHKCDNPPCCNPAHLVLGDAARNASDRKARGREPDRRGEGNGRARLTIDVVASIRSSSSTNVALAREYRVSPKTISDVRTRNTWRHIP